MSTESCTHQPATPDLAARLAEVRESTCDCSRQSTNEDGHYNSCRINDWTPAMSDAILTLLHQVRREAKREERDKTWEHAISIIGDGCEGDLDFALFKMREIRAQGDTE